MVLAELKEPPSGTHLLLVYQPATNQFTTFDVTIGAVGPSGPAGTATHAARPCLDNLHRYVDCGNGTVTDIVTGLVWLKNAACLGSANWAAASRAASALCAR